MSAALSVVVVTHNSAHDLARLTASLERHLAVPAQLIVVDNGSSDASVAVAKSAGAEVIELSENRGFGAANNAGLERASAPVTALLNPDVELLDGGLSRLAERAAARWALIAPRLLGDDGNVQKSAHPVPGSAEAFAFAALGPALPRWLSLRAEPWRSERAVIVGWVVAAALVAQTELLRVLGPFDPEAFLFYEDLDLCLRARSRGAETVLDPQVVLRHRGAHSTAPAYAGEPHAVLAARRREVVRARLGARAATLDDLAQGLTFASRILAKELVRRPSARERAQLAALRAARRRNSR